MPEGMANIVVTVSGGISAFFDGAHRIWEPCRSAPGKVQSCFVPGWHWPDGVAQAASPAVAECKASHEAPALSAPRPLARNAAAPTLPFRRRVARHSPGRSTRWNSLIGRTASFIVRLAPRKRRQGDRDDCSWQQLKAANIACSGGWAATSTCFREGRRRGRRFARDETDAWISLAGVSSLFH